VQTLAVSARIRRGFPECLVVQDLPGGGVPAVFSILQHPDDLLVRGDFDERGSLPLLPREQKIIWLLARQCRVVALARTAKPPAVRVLEFPALSPLELTSRVGQSVPSVISVLPVLGAG
jgi:hypothetical protein